MAQKATTSSTQSSDQEKSAKKDAKKVENFKKRGNAKGKKAIAAIRAVGALANRRVHTWDTGQVNRLFAALSKELDAAATQFDTAKNAKESDEDLI